MLDETEEIEIQTRNLEQSNKEFINEKAMIIN